MSDPLDIETTTETLLAAMREKLSVRAGTLQDAQTKAKRLLPRRIYRNFRVLQKAEPLLGHPKLRLTVDVAALSLANAEVRGYLDEINLADRRKGWWLSLMGSVAFNMIAVVVLLIVVLVWRGFL